MRHILLANDRLYTPTFLLGFIYNFFMALNFTNNAIYPLYITHTGGGAQEIGLFMGVFSAAAVLGRPFVGNLIDRLGTKKVLILGSLCLSLPSLGYLYLLDSGLIFWVWVLRVIQGFGYGAHFSAFFTFAAQYAPPKRRNESMAMFGFSGLLALIIGPYLGETIVNNFGLPLFFITITSFGAVGFLLSLNLPAPERINSASTYNLADLFKVLLSRKLQFVFILALLLAVSMSTPQSFLAPLAHVRKLAQFSLFFTGFSISGMGIRLIGRKWGDRFGLRRVLLPAFFLYSAGLITLHFSNSTEAVFIAGMICGCAHGIGFPAVTALGYNRAPTAYTGTVMALVTGMMDVGTGLTALFLGQAAEEYGYDVVFPLAACAGIVAVLLLAINVMIKPGLILSEKQDI